MNKISAIFKYSKYWSITIMNQKSSGNIKKYKLRFKEKQNFIFVLKLENIG